MEWGGLVVAKWGNSLAVRLPSQLAAALEASEGKQLRLVGMHCADSIEAAYQADAVAGFAEERQATFDSAVPPAGLPVVARQNCQATVGKWGNSLAVRLPRPLVTELGVVEGDRLIFRKGDEAMIDVIREATAEELFARVRALRRAFPADYSFDRDEANSRASLGDATTDE
jgi:antitoxin MazE